MNLKQWRLTRELTLNEASRLLGLDSARTYQRYETGENRPDAPQAERILEITNGDVGLQDLHEQRMQWLRANRPEVFADVPRPAPHLEAAE